MEKQITNNSLILDSLSTNTSFADNSTNQFDNILDIANKSVLKQNTQTVSKDNNIRISNSSDNTTTTSVTDKTSLKSDSTNLNNTNLNKCTNNVNTTNINTNDSALSDDSLENFKSVDSTVDNINNVTQKSQVVDEETENTTNIEDITSQLETLIQTYTMNTLDLSTLNLNLSEDIDLSEIDSIIENIDIDDVESDISIDVELPVDNVSAEVTEPIEITPVNLNLIQDTSSDINSLYNQSQNFDNNLTLKVSSVVEPLEETSYFLPKEKPVNDVLTQDIIDELNVKVEDIDISSADVQIDETLIDNPLMDSAEQAVKYSIEKSDDYFQPKKSENEEIDNLLNIKKVNSEELDTVEDIAEVDVEGLDSLKKDIIKDSDKEIDIDNNVEENNEVVSEDVDYSFSEDGFEQDAKPDSENKQVISKNVKLNNAKEYSEVDVTSEDSTILDETVSNNTISGVGNVGGSSSIHTVQATTATNTTSQTFASANINKDDIIAQIHAKLQSMNANTNTKLTMVLNPESLGKVTIQLANSKSGMVAEMVVASQAVKEILDTNLSSLKDTLTAQGVQVNEVSVKVSESENNAEMDYTEQEGSDSNNSGQGKQQRQQEKNKQEFEQMFSNLEQKNKN